MLLSTYYQHRIAFLNPLSNLILDTSFIHPSPDLVTYPTCSTVVPNTNGFHALVRTSYFGMVASTLTWSGNFPQIPLVGSCYDFTVFPLGSPYLLVVPANVYSDYTFNFQTVEQYSNTTLPYASYLGLISYMYF